MAPPIPPTPKVRRPGPAGGSQGGGYLCDAHLLQARLDDHLASELHARRLKIQSAHGLSTKPAKAAIHIANWAPEEQPFQPRQNRRAEVAMQPGHGPRFDAPEEAVAHDQVVAFPQLLHKG